MSFLFTQKKKVMSLQQQIGDLQNKISILEKQYLAAEQYKDSLRQEAYTVHLYASLSLEAVSYTHLRSCTAIYDGGIPEQRGVFP